ncbi:helix-hairpin-helix domain-containing protein [Tumebacillus lipolyticus]|uniref:Helix-hairpin-helix domain-containing protein n=1 Tax=Tumebacillus lipolyticus TaxID=1280370 RepID=A0ABW4ZU66_9BACL
MRMQKKERLILLVFLFGILLAGSVYLYGGKQGTAKEAGIELEQNMQRTPVLDKIKVHVKGEVHHPGVYQLPTDSRVVDAIQAAGGSTEGADLAGINLAQVIEDGGQIVVPSEAASAQATQPQPPQQAGKLNLNTATAEQLDTLPGIGSIRAQAIVEHRQTHGRFFQVDDLKQISGISKKLIDGLRDKVYVE